LGSGSDAVRVDEWLNILVGRELVARRPRAAYADETEYRFCHDIVREAAYVMLTDTDRTLGHRLAGAWLERKGSRDAPTLAQHFERGHDGARAVAWYELASEEALEGNDFDCALDLAERGIACGAEGPTRGHLRLVQTEALGWRGSFERAERHGLLATQDLRPG